MLRTMARWLSAPACRPYASRRHGASRKRAWGRTAGNTTAKADWRHNGTTGGHRGLRHWRTANRILVGWQRHVARPL